MGIVVDFAKAKKAQEREIQKILKQCDEEEKFIKNFKRNKKKYQEIASAEPKFYREYKINENKTLRLFNDGGYMKMTFYPDGKKI